MRLCFFLNICLISSINGDLSEVGDFFSDLREQRTGTKKKINDMLSEYQFPTSGKSDIKERLHSLWKDNHFLTQADLQLNIKEDIFPWKPTKDRNELKKRRALRTIIRYVISEYIFGNKIDQVEKTFKYHGNTDYTIINCEMEWFKDQLVITNVREGSVSEKKGVKVGWVVKSFNGKQITENNFNNLKRYGLKPGENTVTFLYSKYAHFDRRAIELMTLDNFGTLLDMDLMELSNNAKEKVKEEFLSH